MLGQGDHEWSAGIGPTLPFIMEKEGKLDSEAQTPTDRRELRRAPAGGRIIGQWGAKGASLPRSPMLCVGFEGGATVRKSVTETAITSPQVPDTCHSLLGQHKDLSLRLEGQDSPHGSPVSFRLPSPFRSLQTRHIHTSPPLLGLSSVPPVVLAPAPLLPALLAHVCRHLTSQSQTGLSAVTTPLTGPGTSPTCSVPTLPTLLFPNK